jgi:dTDP-4-amino-4,6-dideoxygalactose transaminase
LIRLAFPDTGDLELAAVAEVLESGFLTMGPKVEEFEAALARACETPHAVCVSNGTAALHLALLALEIGPGDEVVVPAYTFPATANVVLLTGARPVLVDVNPETMNADVERMAAAVTPRTRAILAVHLFGRPVEWEELEAVVPERVALVEDAAGALGARRRGRACGGLGVMGCLSFHPRKIVTTGEGGAVLCRSAEHAEAVRSFRHHGIRTQPAYDIPRPSTNYRLSDLQCAVGIPQLARLDGLLAARTRVAAGYGERLAGRAVLPSAADGDVHGWQAYVIQLERRDEALAELRAEGIEVQIGQYGLHHLSLYSDQGPFPGADRCFEQSLALPLHSRLTDADLDSVTEALERFLT